ncbi:MAG TPA: hypothetical protein VK498_07865, partial [Ferruginibacter sp.]|nr:hypothetical protein [Ferruginibacter sp.]
FSILNEDGPYIMYEGAKWKMYFTSDTDFFVMEERGEMKFTRGTDGNINGFDFFEGNYKTRGTRIE